MQGKYDARLKKNESNVIACSEEENQKMGKRNIKLGAVI
jgi:hypothetical protein